MQKRLLVTLPVLCAFTAQQASADVIGIRDTDDYVDITNRVASMVGNDRAQVLVNQKGLNILNVMWEDTGRYLGSSVGPNISDVTIEVELEGPEGLSRTLMPVIRYPNFTDKTGDVDVDKFFLRVGNESRDGKLHSISMREFLKNPTRYMTLPNDGTIKGGSLLAERDSKLLVSAQTAFLPVPKSGKATFYPVIFNYQSYKDNPAVLTLLITRQGTSMTIVDNSRDTAGNSWGQRLFFNKAGQRAPLIAERLKDVQASGTTANGENAASLGKDANLLLLVQIPLKVKPPRYEIGAAVPEADAAFDKAPAPSAAPMKLGRNKDLDVAVLGHGPTKGPYSELAGLTIERDPRFPIRATVQFYQATSDGEIDAADVAAMHAQIDKVYSHADIVGSLVVPEDNSRRATQWDGLSAPPPGLNWSWFPGLVRRWAHQ